MVDRAGAILTITMPVIDGDITIAGGWYYVLQCTIVTTFALFVVDHLLMVAWMGYTKARWFTLHSIANLVITVLCIPDLIFLLSDPMAALVQKRSDNLPISIIMALHIYHIAIFPKLHWTDVLHHALMIPAMCFQIVGCFGPVANFTNFFVCGVPGGLDYLMLALVKHGKILPLTEKYYNNILNVWVRMPFLICCCWSCGLQMHMQSVTPFITVMRGSGMALQWWNCLYFMERVCGNYYVTAARAKDKKDDGETRPSSNGSSKGGKKDIIADTPEEHPLPSAAGPFAPRNTTFSFSKTVQKIKMAVGS